MTDEIDIETLKKQLADEKGRRIAVERENVQLKRENERVKTEAVETLKDAEQTIAQAATQLAIANAVAGAIHSLGQWARQHLQGAVEALHVIHRETTLVKVIDELVTAGKRYKDSADMQNAISVAEPISKTIKANAEQIRVEIARTSMLAFRRDYSAEIDRIVARAVDGDQKGS